MNEKEAIERVEKYIKSFNGNALDCVAIGTVLTLLEKKDKQIDEMAKEINKITSEKYKIKHICEKGKCVYEECHEDDCNDCIKQYFERKVENGN